jgi:hypothetical protein
MTLSENLRQCDRLPRGEIRRGEVPRAEKKNTIGFERDFRVHDTNVMLDSSLQSIEVEQLVQ